MTSTMAGGKPMIYLSRETKCRLSEIAHEKKMKSYEAVIIWLLEKKDK